MATRWTYDAVARAISSIRPGALWSFGESPEEIVWSDTEQDMPYTEEIDAIIDALQLDKKIAGIRTEALRRIRVRYEDWQQSHMVVQGVRLQDTWRQNGFWTENELALWEELVARWDWIDSVRAVADQLEIDQPDNYMVDDYWPAP